MLYFKVPSTEKKVQRRLTLLVMDWERLGKDKKIGKVTFIINDIFHA